MTTLATLIDSLPAPTLPSSYSAQDRELILLALLAARQKARPYNGDYKAPWLLSEFSDPEWVTTNRGRQEIICGEWKNVVRVDWRLQLPNGALLTDPRYERLLNTTKRIAFLVRSGHVGNISVPVTWRGLVCMQQRLARWVVLHEKRFLPEIYGYRLLDQAAIESLFLMLAEGGWTFALQVPQRLLAAFHKSALGEPCPDEWLSNPYALPQSFISLIIPWLKRQGFYGKVKRGANIGKQYLKREPLANMICEPTRGMSASLKLGAFFRQFEPDLQSGKLLISLHQLTELPDHKTRTTKDVIESGMSENSLQSGANTVATILSAHRHDCEFLPEPGLLSVRRAQALALRQTRQSSHNLFIPINVGLAYLNESIRFVHVYGEAIIKFYLAVASTRTATTTLEDLDAAVQSMSKDWAVASGETISSILNISGFQRVAPKADFTSLRSSPTLNEALRVLIGSCVISIALLKPSRENELTHLKRNCLKNGDSGYYINYALGKSNAGEAHQQADRPIPLITAKAIRLLQHLGDGLTKLYADDSKAAENLFYLPQIDATFGALSANSSLLNMHIDTLCDYVGLPPDSMGRRWYVRIHEMRKWFLLLLFWSGRYDVLDAARWIAGHTNASHIYAYIEREFPGEELPKLEAEYTVERLRVLEARGRREMSPDETGLDCLYEAVLKHFNVKSLAMVPESEWSDYVTTLRESEGFVLEPHSVYADNGTEVVGINVSFVLREEGK